MKKLLITIFMLVSLNAHAGFKGGVDLEQSSYKTDKTWVCKDNGTVCQGYLAPDKTGNRPRGYIGYEHGITGNLGVDANLSLSSSTDARIDANLLYGVSDRVALKAGPNAILVLQDMYSSSTKRTVTPKPGFQIGVDYKLNDKIILAGQLTKSTQSIAYEGYNDQIQLETQSVSLGVRFNF